MVNKNINPRTGHSTTETRIIKKYPNRRLYDTKHSKYITLKDVHNLVLAEVPFNVIDVKNGNDLTRATLLQIFNTLEDDSHPLFTSDLLKTVIGFYDDPMHSMLSRYLEHSIAVFRDHLADLKSPINSLLESKTQLNVLHDLAERSIEEWQGNRR